MSSFLYKELHKLKFVPPPTIEGKVLTNVLKEINGRKPRQTRTMEDTTNETTEKINTTFDYNTTNIIDLHADTDSTSSITATTTRTSTTEEQLLFVQQHYHFDTSTSAYYRPTFELNLLLNKITLLLLLCKAHTWAKQLLLTSINQTLL